MLATSFKTDANGSGLDHHDPARVAAIADYEIVDTVSEAEFNHIVELTASLFQTPASMISIIGEEFQFFIARTGLEVSSTPVAVSFCVNALKSDKPFVINDVRENDCFASNPLVLGPPYIRFYAGAPLRTASGLVLGTLCIIDTEPRSFGPREQDTLSRLATLVIDRLELRRSERKRAVQEKRLRHLAHFDQLTGLLNRAGFEERASHILQQGTAVAMLLFDLDGFKDVNDACGHAVGDELLKAVADRMTQVTEDGHLLARLGGDEFVLFIPGLCDGDEAFRFADRMRSVFRQSFPVSGELLKIDTCVGISLSPEHGKSVEDLLCCADLALYKAKGMGGGSRAAFEPKLKHKLNERRALQAALNDAFVGGEFELYYQPRVRTSDRVIVGAEALLRWKHPERGLLLPEDFLAVLERMPIACAVGDWVVRKAISQAANWAAQGVKLKISVNLFSAQLTRKDLSTFIANELDVHGVSPNAFEVELTETIAIRDMKSASMHLASLRAQGVGIALDDFGTGYASLSLLKDLPVTCIKIDRSFVEQAGSDNHDSGVIEALVVLSRAFNLHLVAEGVEHFEQEQFLKQVGCHEAQGFFYKHPVSAAELSGMLSFRN